MSHSWDRVARLRAVLVALSSPLVTATVTAAIVLGAHWLGLDRPGPVGITTAAGLFVVAVLVTLIGRCATRRSRMGVRSGERDLSDGWLPSPVFNRPTFRDLLAMLRFGAGRCCAQGRPV